jgi:hypothetical protein
MEGLIAWAEERRKIQELPCLVWRQTLPQHFSTSDGVYERDHERVHAGVAATARDRSKLSKGCCEPLNEGLLGGEQKFNDVTDAMLKGSGIRIANLYKAFVPLYQQHVGCSRSKHLVDCTNYQNEVYMLANLMTVKYIKPVF